MVSATRLPSASAITAFTAALPIAVIGIRTVVSGGSRYWATGASWNAMTDTSAGTVSPARRAAAA